MVSDPDFRGARFKPFLRAQAEPMEHVEHAGRQIHQRSERNATGDQEVLPDRDLDEAWRTAHHFACG